MFYNAGALDRWITGNYGEDAFLLDCPGLEDENFCNQRRTCNCKSHDCDNCNFDLERYLEDQKRDKG